MKTINWNTEKAEQLRSDTTRNKVGFERCAVAIENGDILDVLDNPTRSNQRMFVLEIDEYAYVVPFVETEEEIFLKTVFPSRKQTVLYLNR